MRIAIHAFDGISLFHLAAPSLVFGEVARLGLAPTWETIVWSESSHVRTVDGVLLSDLSSPADAAAADVLVFPSWHGDLRRTGSETIDMMRKAHGRGARVVGLCLGAFPVVDSGLLDGRAAVTHWGAAAALSSRRHDVTVNADAIYIDHGDILTSAGTASAIDACLHVVRTLLGSDAAATIARHLVVAPHRDGGQSQYVLRPVPAHDGSAQLGGTIDWALAHLDQPLTVDVMSAHAGMSRRNFTRRFAETTGLSPAAWVLSRRLDESRRVLERTPLPIDKVARECGFNSVVTFRQRFAAAYGTTPSSYRRRFAD